MSNSIQIRQHNISWKEVKRCLLLFHRCKFMVTNKVKVFHTGHKFLFEICLLISSSVEGKTIQLGISLSLTKFISCSRTKKLPCRLYLWRLYMKCALGLSSGDILQVGKVSRARKYSKRHKTTREHYPSAASVPSASR